MKLTEDDKTELRVLVTNELLTLHNQLSTAKICGVTARALAIDNRIGRLKELNGKLQLKELTV